MTPGALAAGRFAESGRAGRQSSLPVGGTPVAGRLLPRFHQVVRGAECRPLYQAAAARPHIPMTTLTSLLLRLPQPILTWVVNARTLLRHPMALVTIGVVFRRDLAADAGTPWWNDRAIRYLGQHLRPGDRVFEWGSGASTVWLASRGANVTSIEHDLEWVSKVRARCPAADVRTVPDNAGDYVAAIDAYRDDSFDVVIVDGIHRPECLRRGTSKVRPGGLLILDDTDQRQLARVKKSSLPGWKTVSFTGFKATKDVRETTFFCRPQLPSPTSADTPIACRTTSGYSGGGEGRHSRKYARTPGFRR